MKARTRCNRPHPVSGTCALDAGHRGHHSTLGEWSVGLRDEPAKLVRPHSISENEGGSHPAGGRR